VLETLELVSRVANRIGDIKVNTGSRKHVAKARKRRLK